jgi:hypothetical protein
MAKLILDKETKEVLFIVTDEQGVPEDESKEVVSITDKDVASLIQEMHDSHPEVKHVWKDPKDGVWKEVKEFPTHRFKYVDGKFEHNFDIENNLSPIK